MRALVPLMLCGCVAASSSTPTTFLVSEEPSVREGKELVLQETSIPGHRMALPQKRQGSPALSSFLEEMKKLHGQKQTDAFEKLLSRVSNPNKGVDKASLMRRAEEAMKAKRYKDAVDIYLEILKSDPWDKEALAGYQKATRLSRQRLVIPTTKPTAKPPSTPPTAPPAKSASQPPKPQPTSLQSLFDKAEEAYRARRWNEAELLFMQLLTEAMASTDPKAVHFYKVAKERIKELSRKKEKQP